MTTTTQSMGIGIGRNHGRASTAHRAWSLEMAIMVIREEIIITECRTRGRIHSKGQRISTNCQHSKIVEPR